MVTAAHWHSRTAAPHIKWRFMYLLNNERGLSLIELLVALTILAVGLLPIIISLNKLEYNTYKIGIISDATELGSQKIEDLRALGFENIDSGIMQGNLTVSVDEGSIDNTIFSRKSILTFQELNPDGSFKTAAVPNTDYIRIDSVVSYRFGNEQRNDTVTTVMSRYGMRQ